MYEEEIRRRRTFAIISHPDAGKTTTTERLLYHGGVIHQMGEVNAKAGRKSTRSDWMTMERERGISITSSVMQFDYKGLMVNLVDTPGHKDFSEDTYRTLVAVDSALMVIDGAKGVEERTRKLYEVCRYRQIPIFTFVNKMDRESKSPIELIDEIERTLKMACAPVMWPIGSGDRFSGVYHRLRRELILWNKVNRTYDRHPCEELAEANDQLKSKIPRDVFEQACQELELVAGALPDIVASDFLEGRITPIFFGSAKQDFGVDLFLDSFVELAPGPQPRKSSLGLIDPFSDYFSAHVFKIQANMDPNHRDRVAFARICSGQFERGMKVKNVRSTKILRLAYSNQFLAQERKTVDTAFAGDVVGLNDTGNFLIGDTITSGPDLEFENIPRFTPELFAKVLVGDAMKKKQLQKGVQQLTEEGTVQLFYDPLIGPQEPIIGAVGELQFEVLAHRLKDEYGLDVRIERLALAVARWPKKEGKPYAGEVKGSALKVIDVFGDQVVLVAKEWDLNWLKKENPDIEFSTPISAKR